MMYVCEKCGRLFEEPSVSQGSVGEFWGQPACENYGCSPCCGYDYHEAERCEICGEWYDGEKIHGVACEDCIAEHKNDFDTCYDIALDAGDRVEVKINSAIASLLDESDIDAILKEYIKERMPDACMDEYIESDIYWFGERLAERKGE